MKKVFITLALALAMFTAQSQNLVADETTQTELKASIKIETSNEAIFSAILKDFQAEVTKYTVSFKSDRSGRYKEYAINFKKEYADKLKQFFSRINKAK